MASEPSLALREPLMPEFRVGGIDLDYDRLHDLVVLTLVDGTPQDFDSLEDVDVDLSEGVELLIYTTRGRRLSCWRARPKTSFRRGDRFVPRAASR